MPAPKSGVPGKTKDILQNGFRKGRLPPNVASTRFWNAGLPRYSIQSLTSGLNGYIAGAAIPTEKLAGASMSCFGAGSIGAPVAIQLQSAEWAAGYHQSEPLTAANTGRHPLGAKFIDRNKAEALAVELRETPHITRLNSTRTDGRRSTTRSRRLCQRFPDYQRDRRLGHGRRFECVACRSRQITASSLWVDRGTCVCGPCRLDQRGGGASSPVASTRVAGSNYGITIGPAPK